MQSASHSLASHIRGALSGHGLSVRAAERGAGMPQRSIQAVLDGHIPSLDRAAAIADALGLELYIGPPRDSAPPAPVAPPPPPLPVPVRDRALAELLAAIVRRWESLPAAEQGYLVADLWAAGGSGLRAQGGRRLARLAGD